jgi:hypothetical protein
VDGSETEMSIVVSSITRKGYSPGAKIMARLWLGREDANQMRAQEPTFGHGRLLGAAVVLAILFTVATFLVTP